MLSNSVSSETYSVGLRSLRLTVSIGIYPYEKVTPQPIDVSVTMNILKPENGFSDLEDTIDYASVAAIIRDVTATHHDLIEQLAMSLCDKILSVDPRIASTEIEILKLNAIPDATGSFVRMKNERP